MNSFRKYLGLFLPSGKDYECPFPTGEGKTTCSQSLQERGKTPCVQPLRERVKIPCIQSSSEGKDLCTVSKVGHFKSVITRGSKRPDSREQTQAFSYQIGRTRGPPVIFDSNQGRLQTTFQRTPKSVQVALQCQQLRKLQQTNLLLKGTSEVVHAQNSLGLYSQLFLVPKPGNRWRLLKQIVGHTKIQDGGPRVNTCHPQERRVGHLYRSNGYLPACTYPYPVSKISQIPPQRRHLPVYQPTVWPSYSPSSLYQPPEGSKASSFTTGNQTTPVSIRLANLCPLQGGVRHTDTITTQTHRHTKSELRPSHRFDFLGYHFLLEMALVKPTQDRWTKLQEIFHCLSLSEVCYQCKHSCVHN